MIDLPYSAFTFYDEAKWQMAVTAGEYEVWYGTSSADKDLKMVKVSIE